MVEKGSDTQNSTACGSSDPSDFPLFCPFHVSHQILMQTTFSRHSSVVPGASALKVSMPTALESSQVMPALTPHTGSSWEVCLSGDNRILAQ